MYLCHFVAKCYSRFKVNFKEIQYNCCRTKQMSQKMRAVLLRNPKLFYCRKENLLICPCPLYTYISYTVWSGNWGYVSAILKIDWPVGKRIENSNSVFLENGIM